MRQGLLHQKSREVDVNECQSIAFLPPIAARDQTVFVAMKGVLKEDIRSLLHLVSLGVVGAATVGVFFGIGLMWLTDPRPAALPEHPVRSEQALQAHAVLAPVIERAAPDSSPVLPSEKVAASPISDAPIDRATVAVGSAEMASKPILPRRIAHAKRVRLSRPRHQKPSDIGPRHGDPMPAPGQVQAAAFTVLPIAMSGT